MPSFQLQARTHCAWLSDHIRSDSLSCVPMPELHKEVPGQDSGDHCMSTKAEQHKDEQGTGGSNPGKVLNM